MECKVNRRGFHIYVGFKLKVTKYAKQQSNRAAERHSGPPPTKNMTQEKRRQRRNYRSYRRINTLFIHNCKMA
jgi:hypothetical protein